MYNKSILVLIFFINCAICYKLKAISSKRWIKPHSPYYDAPRNRLLFIDLTNGTIINYDLESQAIYERQNSNGMELIILQDALFEVDSSPALKKNNLLVGKASPQCKFYGGTYRTGMCGDTSPTFGLLYRYDKCKGVKQLISDLKVSGGFDWSPNGDTCNKQISAYDYDGKTGKVCKERVVFSYPGSGCFDDTNNPYANSTLPLGMTTDDEGCIYVALYYGGAVLKINSKTGKVVKVIHLPAQVIGSVAWGGKNNDIFNGRNREYYTFIRQRQSLYGVWPQSKRLTRKTSLCLNYLCIFFNKIQHSNKNISKRLLKKLLQFGCVNIFS
ncbi:uncharacterized protein LOC116339728 [Contarinia nasturtii]|uniref:uncharacterized protein LOC116339728 n=1 Tax=Contarinia nasturtii TaxID=265458 RepID=UPI0012D4C40D|nr:uncharacterized protein LOC116339728 [Contarinia nasturtii]